MKKRRILWCGESSHIPSGFGNFTREILSRLYQTQKYEIAELSSFRTHTIPKTEPWKIYPVAVPTDHPLYTEYTSGGTNQFGHWRFDAALLDFQPDIVIDIRDFWNFTFQEYSCLRPFYRWIISPTYDSSPPKISTFYTFLNADLVLFHTEWAKKDLTALDKNNKINIGDVISDSVNTDIFKPIQYSKAHHKIKYGIDNNTFIIGSVMRNQKRKLIPELFKIFKKLKTKNNSKNIILYLHTSYPEFEGWNLPVLLLEYDIADSVFLTYRCRSCGEYRPSVYCGENKPCFKCGKNSSICGLHNAISPYELNNIYNLFDIYVQYAICEGFGIPQVEAASAGVPVITVDHGAMREVGDNIGASIIKVLNSYKEVQTEADRVYPDNNHCEMILQSFIDMPLSDLINKSKLTRQMLTEHYSWDQTAKKLELIFDDIDITKNKDWNSNESLVDTNLKIPSITSNRDFIYYIIDNVIKDNFLKNTNYIQEMIKNLDVGIVINSNNHQAYTKKQAVKELEVYISNKIAIEKIRTKQMNLPDKFKEFLAY